MDRLIYHAAMTLQEVENGVVIRIRVKPGARRFSIKRTGDHIILEVKSPPVDGRANEEAIRELSLLFGKPLKLLKGGKSRQKVLLIRGAALSEVESRLDRILSKEQKEPLS